jgi:hypothetical protein
MTKIWLVDTLGLSKDALHIYVGLILFFGTVTLFRLPLRDIRPLMAVLLAALLGEILDIYDTSVIGAPQVYAGNWHDFWNTMFWPTALFVLARYTPVLQR